LLIFCRHDCKNGCGGSVFVLGKKTSERERERERERESEKNGCYFCFGEEDVREREREREKKKKGAVFVLEKKKIATMYYNKFLNMKIYCNIFIKKYYFKRFIGEKKNTKFIQKISLKNLSEMFL
jgi:hypothetical protein